MVLRRSARAVIARAVLIATALLALGTIASPAAASPIGRADVSDFTFASMDVVYELSRDEAGRSVLDTTETLVARFPETDQNRGIRRAIPLDFDGHPVDPRVVGVTDETGAPRAYETEEDDGFLVVTIADEEYVHGDQTYVISYAQRNVTHVPDDADLDEFAWDVNGTGWEQPFARVTAELRVDDELTERFAGRAACYQGPEGSTSSCDALDAGGEPFVLSAAANDLAPHENLTIAAAFEPGTFTPREDRFFASPAAVLGGVGALLALAAAVTALALRATRWRHHPGRGIVVAEYRPPAGTTVMEAAELVGHADRGVSASLLALAVAGRVRVIETPAGAFEVELASGAPPADADARELTTLLFPSGEPGERRDLTPRDTKLARKLYALRQRVAKHVVERGWRRTPDGPLRSMLAIVAIVGAVAGFVFGVVALDAAMGGPWPVILLIVGMLAAITAIIAVASVRPLTERGRALRDHLEGLREYIRLAEADRLAMLQSPAGALRVPADPAGAAGRPDGDAARPDDAVLRITERLLPYAVLFGLEREWSRELAALYDARGETPGWYDGRDGFTAAAFASGVHGFSAASAASWSGSASSSTSSSSGGGGASGSGGGGGGGGGV